MCITNQNHNFQKHKQMQYKRQCRYVRRQNKVLFAGWTGLGATHYQWYWLQCSTLHVWAYKDKNLIADLRERSWDLRNEILASKWPLGFCKAFSTTLLVHRAKQEHYSWLMVYTAIMKRYIGKYVIVGLSKPTRLVLQLLLEQSQM